MHQQPNQCEKNWSAPKSASREGRRRAEGCENRQEKGRQKETRTEKHSVPKIGKHGAKGEKKRAPIPWPLRLTTIAEQGPKAPARNNEE